MKNGACKHSPKATHWISSRGSELLVARDAPFELQGTLQWVGREVSALEKRPGGSCRLHTPTHHLGEETWSAAPLQRSCAGACPSRGTFRTRRGRNEAQRTARGRCCKGPGWGSLLSLKNGTRRSPWSRSPPSRTLHAGATIVEFVPSNILTLAAHGTRVRPTLTLLEVRIATLTFFDDLPQLPVTGLAVLFDLRRFASQRSKALLPAMPSQCRRTVCHSARCKKTQDQSKRASASRAQGLPASNLLPSASLQLPWLSFLLLRSDRGWWSKRLHWPRKIAYPTNQQLLLPCALLLPSFRT